LSLANHWPKSVSQLIFASLQKLSRSIPASGKKFSQSACFDSKSDGMRIALSSEQINQTAAKSRPKIDERRSVMEEISDVNTMFSLFNTAEGLSPVERLLNDFEAHEAKEEKALETYRNLAGQMPSPLTRFLLQMIISDEEKHRAVIHAMVATLKGSLNWTKPKDSLEGGSDSVNLNGELRAATEEFLQLERDGIREYKVLIKESSDYYHGLFKILLDSMVRDSEKHIDLLEFLRESLKTA
jgi:rubrerythrin